MAFIPMMAIINSNLGCALYKDTWGGRLGNDIPGVSLALSQDLFRKAESPITSLSTHVLMHVMT